MEILQIHLKRNHYLSDAELVLKSCIVLAMCRIKNKLNKCCVISTLKRETDSIYNDLFGNATYDRKSFAYILALLCREKTIDKIISTDDDLYRINNDSYEILERFCKEVWREQINNNITFSIPDYELLKRFKQEPINLPKITSQAENIQDADISQSVYITKKIKPVETVLQNKVTESPTVVSQNTVESPTLAVSQNTTLNVNFSNRNMITAASIIGIIPDSKPTVCDSKTAICDSNDSLVIDAVNFNPLDIYNSNYGLRYPRRLDKIDAWGNCIIS